MRRLSQVFSALTLLALITLAVVALYFRAPPPTVALPPLVGQIDKIIVEKAARRLTLVQDGRALRSYAIALGFQPVGDKTRQGDGRTPEGLYRINRRNAQSAFHLSLGLDYPQPQDVARARAGGYDPGGDIMLHGQPNSLPDATHLPGDWTAGCIALTNAEIREIWAATPMGTAVEIRP